MFRGYFSFVREFFRSTYNTGAILPSGPRLCRKIAKYVDFDREPEMLRQIRQASGEKDHSSEIGRHILEVGPGTGCITREIAKLMGPHDKLDLIECNQNFVERLHLMLEKDPVMQKVADRVQIFTCYLQDFPTEQKYDRIISGLPLNNFPVELVQEILAHFQKLSAPGAVVSWFEYIAIRRIKSVISKKADRIRLRGITDSLNAVLDPYEFQRDAILFNVPSAWVHHVCFDLEKTKK